VTLETPKYSKKEVAIAKDTVLVLLEIQAASLTPVREGLDLVAVLDVSGSMKDEEGGQKLSKMKKAMEFLILKLAPADRLSIVTFATGDKKFCGLRSMKADAKPAIQTIIRDLKAEGGTNIAAGLKTALAIIRGRKYSQGRTANIFLMSDGRQTDTDKAEDVDAGEVPVYTFGIGKDADCVVW
jgi:Mg-chelatase subunit ChlD